MSYDEIGLAALVSVSSPTFFINNGSRGNCAQPGRPGTFQPWGIYVGMVGCRFERQSVMEDQHMNITRSQNTKANGYGPGGNPLLAVWARFYNIPHFPLYEEAEEEYSRWVSAPPASRGPQRYLKLGFLSSPDYFDMHVYVRRMKMVVEPFLAEANQRAAQHHLKAYVHMVGLGLGVWKLCEEQTQLLVEVCAQVLYEQSLPHISDLDFSYFSADTCGGVASGQQFQNGKGTDVTIWFSRREPAAPLPPDRLLVACYAWDGNSRPGNEYWCGALSASGDPAAACCSYISELQNPDCNPAVCGANTRVGQGSQLAPISATL
eukprot:TRINITY_DN10891_c0_g1_i1.p1 TRINITY_DN10891_c0_g1~~TRINITY_DN10891_c0_g1_i1.p1  ORF type:complete len:320 (-),score=34.96 TRINITY_DN10891_c0_g1_i1:411-1370(-)